MTELYGGGGGKSESSTSPKVINKDWSLSENSGNRLGFDINFDCVERLLHFHVDYTVETWAALL